jgi:hypothetical protein
MPDGAFFFRQRAERTLYNTRAGHIAKKNQLLTDLFLLLIYNCKRGIQWAGHTLECA